MKKHKIFSVLTGVIILSSFALEITGCSADDDDDDISTNSTADLKYLSIANAKSLYISAGSSARAARDANSTTNKIFKITEDGYTQEVTYLDEDEKEITIAQQPVAIYPINDDYLLVGFGYSDYINTWYLVRKSDGAAFDMKNAGNVETNRFSDFKNPSLFLTDKSNNLYYLVYPDNNSSRKTVVKVNLAGIDSLASSEVVPSTDIVENFAVTGAGNIIYGGYLASDYSNRMYRIRKANGSLYNISNVAAYWVGLDDNIYYFSSDLTDYKYDSETGYGFPIKKIVVDENYTVSEDIYGYFGESNVNLYQANSYKLKLKDRILIINASSGNSNTPIYEVYNVTGTPRVVTLESLTLKSITTVGSTENFYYIAGTDSSNSTIFIKVDATTDKYTHLLAQNDYDVYSFAASEADGITFNALRMSDGKKIIGKVGVNGGDVTVIDEESDVQISYLQRVN